MASAAPSLSSLQSPVSAPKSGSLGSLLVDGKPGSWALMSAVIDTTVQPIPVDTVIIARPSDLPLLIVAATYHPPTSDNSSCPGQALFSFFKLSRVMSEFTTSTSAKSIATWDAGCFHRTGQWVRMRSKPTMRRRDFMPIVAVSHRLSPIGEGLMQSPAVKAGSKCLHTYASSRAQKPPPRPFTF